MPDRFEEITTQSWASRITQSFTGLLIGPILCIIALPILFFNEKRAVTTTRFLDQSLALIISVDSAQVNPENNGKLIHTTGALTVTKPIDDPVFKVSATTAVLERSTFMYQWVEKQHSESQESIGGSKETRTTYEYSKGWFDHPINSSSFKEQAAHENPSTLRFASKNFFNETAALGKFSVPDTFLAQLPCSHEISPLQSTLTQITDATLQKELTIYDNKLYVAKNPATPAIGDIQITFRQAQPSSVSIIARQINNTFEPYELNGKKLGLLKEGTLSAQTMIEYEKSANRVLTWFLRLVGFLCLWIGLMLIAAPLSTFLAVIPLLSMLASTAVSVVAFIIALLVASCVIAVGWFAYRPLIAAIILCSALLIAALVFMIKKKK